MPIRIAAAVLRRLAACLQYAGTVATMALLSGTLLVLANEIALILGFAALFDGPDYAAWLTLFAKPHAWAAATTLVGTTVALASLRKFDLDNEAAMDRRLDRAMARLQAREARNAAVQRKLHTALRHRG
ncbi:hypothetical protein N8I74_02395 [Chitiniphilus purpureus]|uniref:Uncharacterized protein n=1 Tax=Chitiniphilus purpureus TaxID=2981137 RepID=A0ABY6DNG1_9NEIS|nr:hypothetical protein [Chitiniphilus sp. CD1]UXY15886.1 hypothetical protein N8I74_02395 [Chitiniphilus sp. CD1]